MLTKKITTTVLLISLFSTVGMAMAGKEDFSVADFNRLIKGDKNLSHSKLEGANLHGKNLSGVDFRNADLEKANLSNSDLTNANFQNADLEEANLKGAKIKGAIFKSTELEFATWVDGRICAEGSIGGCW